MTGEFLEGKDLNKVIPEALFEGNVNEAYEKDRNALYAKMQQRLNEDGTLKEKSLEEIKEIVLTEAAHNKFFDIPTDVYDRHVQELQSSEHSVESMRAIVVQELDNLANVIAHAIKNGEQLL